MRLVYDKDGTVIGSCNDKMTKPQRRRKERALHRLLFELEKEQKEFEAFKKTFPLDVGEHATSTPTIDRMKREAYKLRSKLGICTDEQLEEFHKRMCDL